MKPAAILFLLAALAAPAKMPGVTEDFISSHEEHMERLFGALDPAHPRMAPILSLWRDGARADAADALLRHFDERTFPLQLLDAPGIPAGLFAEADAALGNTFRLNERRETIATKPDGGLDWTDRGSRGDKENAWMLNRHMFLPVLAEAWRQSGDQRYREKLNTLWLDWVVSNPYPGRLTFSAQWRPLEVARRVMNSWIHVFFGSGALDPETRLLVLSSIPEHGDSLRHHASFWGGNHLISEKIALLSLAAAWPEFRESGDWREYAVERASAEILRQTYPDGSYKELSNHYQRVVLVNAMTLLQLLEWSGDNLRERPVYARVEKMWEFFAGVMRPDGTGPVNNASDEENNAMLLESVWKFFDRPDWLGMATNGARGNLPHGSPSRLFPWAGQAVIRNNWGPRADWIYFDAGPYGTAHQHVDHLHVSAWLDGRPVLTDSGRYTYLPGKWKDYFHGAEGHSLILLDGRPSEQGPMSTPAPMRIAFTETPEAVFTAARTSFLPAPVAGILPSPEAAVPWTRAILYDKRGFALILDHLVTFAEHMVEARWHFHPDIDAEEAPVLLRLLAPGTAMQTSIATGSESPSLGGFYSPEYNIRRPSALLRFNGSINKPTTFVWLVGSGGSVPAEISVSSKRGSPVIEFTLSSGDHALAKARLRLYPEPMLIDYKAMQSGPAQGN
jgi:hypothetical protein